MLYENTLKKNIIKCYTDGSETNGRAGASFYKQYPNGSHTDQKSFYLERHRPTGSIVFQAEVFAIAEAAKKLIMEKFLNEKIPVFVDSQVAILVLAIQNNIVRSAIVITCIKLLSNYVSIAWTPGHTGISGNEKPDILATLESAPSAAVHLQTSPCSYSEA